jgi:hypothetical protein
MAVNLLALTSVTFAALYEGQPTTSEATLATCPASTTWRADSVVLCNTTSTAATISLSRVPSGGTAGATNRFMSAFSVPANDTVTVDVKQYLNAGDFLSGLQGTSAAVTVTINGVVFA